MSGPSPLPRAMVSTGVVCDIRHVAIPQVRQYIEAFSDKVYPPFADPERDAERVAQEYWDERMSEPVYDDNDVDPGSIADDAQERSLSFYFRLTAMQFTVVNLFTAGLYHLLEQQAAELLRSWEVPPGREPLDTLREVLTTQFGFSFETVSSWSRVQQLNDVANVVKHADGSSAERLRKTCPKLFELPLLRRPEYRDLRMRSGPHRPVGAPLTGEDVYVTKEDFDLYAQAVLDLWDWLASGFEKLSERPARAD